MKPIILSLAGLEKRLGLNKILQGASLELMAQESTLLLGENGAGKTTLLRIAAGLLLPDKGRVHWLEQDTTSPNTHVRALIGAISHQKGFYAELSGRENLRLIALLYQVDAGCLDEVLDMLNLGAWVDAPVATYSSGTLQRLALARCLIQKPRLLLLDEPYAGLDRRTTEMVAHILQQFTQAGGTVLMTTHHIPATLARLQMRTVWLQNGKITRQPPRTQP